MLFVSAPRRNSPVKTLSGHLCQLLKRESLRLCQGEVARQGGVRFLTASPINSSPLKVRKVKTARFLWSIQSQPPPPSLRRLRESDRRTPLIVELQVQLCDGILFLRQQPSAMMYSSPWEWMILEHFGMLLPLRSLIPKRYLKRPLSGS